MYLFSIEGGDGSGKGLAAEIVSEILQSEFCFTSVESTAEPRRDHALGRLAIDSVRKQTLTPEEEAGLLLRIGLTILMDLDPTSPSRG